MAFGQSSGPPATGQQIRQLLELLAAAGHRDFRDARGPMGFTQRQAGGKFTRDEADSFIERLEAEAEAEAEAETEAPAATVAPRTVSKVVPRNTSKVASSSPAPPGTQRGEVALGEVPTKLLAAELQRRGWIVVEP